MEYLFLVIVALAAAPVVMTGLVFMHWYFACREGLSSAAVFSPREAELSKHARSAQRYVTLSVVCLAAFGVIVLVAVVQGRS